jgi:hypothetical protein
MSLAAGQWTIPYGGDEYVVTCINEFLSIIKVE